jgi:hypothetical protein
MAGLLDKGNDEIYCDEDWALVLGGIEPGYDHFGKSLLPLMSGNIDSIREAVFCEGGRRLGEEQAMEKLGLSTPPNSDSLYGNLRCGFAQRRLALSARASPESMTPICWPMSANSMLPGSGGHIFIDS